MHKIKSPKIQGEMLNMSTQIIESQVKETSVISNPVSLWCSDSNQSLKNASDLPDVDTRIELEPLRSSFGPFS